jgi:hypothetical protein
MTVHSSWTRPMSGSDWSSRSDLHGRDQSAGDDGSVPGGSARPYWHATRVTPCPFAHNPSTQYIVRDQGIPMAVHENQPRALGADADP